MTEMSDPTDMRIKMTIMVWSNMLTNKINELINDNWVINEKLFLRNGQNGANLKDVVIFKAKEKKFRQSAIKYLQIRSILGWGDFYARQRRAMSDYKYTKLDFVDRPWPWRGKKESTIYCAMFCTCRNLCAYKM